MTCLVIFLKMFIAPLPPPWYWFLDLLLRLHQSRLLTASGTAILITNQKKLLTSTPQKTHCVEPYSVYFYLVFVRLSFLSCRSIFKSNLEAIFLFIFTDSSSIWYPALSLTAPHWFIKMRIFQLSITFAQEYTILLDVMLIQVKVQIDLFYFQHSIPHLAKNTHYEFKVVPDL